MGLGLKIRTEDLGITAPVEEAVVVRELTVGDVVRETPAFGARRLSKLRERHHRVARLLASGLQAQEVSAITGMAQSTISVLMGDEMFADLLAFYGDRVDKEFQDVLDQLKTLSIEAINELIDRLEDDEGTITIGQLMSMAELGLDRTGYAKTVNVKGQINHAILTLDDIKNIKSQRAENSVQVTTIEGRHTAIAIGGTNERGAELQTRALEGSDSEGS